MKSKLSVRYADFLILFLGCAFLLSRAPFIFSGYGLDPDAYLVMLSAHKMLATSRYWMSRPPGYPVFEITCAFLSSGGFLATNGMTVLISFLCIFPLTQILRSLRVRNQVWILIAFCFAPIIWIESTCTMDYMWALFFILLAFSFSFRRKYFMGAVFLGVAVGFRITSGLMILPLCLYMFFQENRERRENQGSQESMESRKGKVREIILPPLIFGLTCLLVYTPVFLSYGLSFLNYLSTQDPLFVWGYRTMSELFGFPAFLILTFGIAAFIFKRAKGRMDDDTKVLLLIVVLYSILFLKLPAETAYLIPLIPFGLIVLEKIFSRKLFVLFCIFFVLNGVISLAAIDKKAYRKDGQIRFIPFDYGTVIKNEIRKRVIYQNSQKIATRAEDLARGNKSAVIIGWYKPTFQFLNRRDLEEVMIDQRIPALKRKGKELFFLESVTDEDVRFLRAANFSFYHLDAVRGATAAKDDDLFTYSRQIPGIDSYPVNY